MTEIFALHVRPADPLLGLPAHTILIPGSAVPGSPADLFEVVVRPRTRFGAAMDAPVDPLRVLAYDGNGIPEWPRVRRLAAIAAEVGYAVSYTRIAASLDGRLVFKAVFRGEVRYALAVDDPWLILGSYLGLSDAEIGYAVAGGGRRAESTCEATLLARACDAWLGQERPNEPQELVDTIEGVRRVAVYAAEKGLAIGWRP